MTKRHIEILINLLFWIATAWLISSGFSIQSQEIEFINNEKQVHITRNPIIINSLLFCISICIFQFYMVKANIISLSKRDNKNKVIGFNFILLGLSIGLYYVATKIAGSIGLPLALIVGINIFYFTIAITYGLARLYIIIEKKQEALILQKKQSELNLLRNQLQPHFLFNALNNLLAMVDQKEHALLASSIDKLSNLLRYVIEESARGKTTIGNEIAFIKNYSSLQLLRFDQKEVNFNMQVKGTYLDQKLEPGIFISFVENAFKYGALAEECSTINVEFCIEKNNEVHFKIDNVVYPALQRNNGSGKGIAAAKERLNLVYPGMHSLRIEQSGMYSVDLKIRTHESNNR